MSKLSQSVELTEQGNIALISVDNPPVNALSYHVRQGLVDALKAAERLDVQAIVLICRGRTFIAGADITETTYEMMEKGPIIWVAQSVMEECSKPVIVAIHGTCLGGGLETALCGHYRVATASAQFGLPEVTLGRVPGGGGTQRLPRITGLEKALQMIIGGERIGAQEALECGLIDQIVDDLESGAIAFAHKIIDQNKPLVRIRDRNDKLKDTDPDIFARMRKKIEHEMRGFLAPEANIKALEAALELDFDDGLERAREIASQLREGPQAKALQYSFFAERAANKIPGLSKGTPQIEINTVGIIGVSDVAMELIISLANAGISITVIGQNESALENCLSLIHEHYARAVIREELTSDEVNARIKLIKGSLAWHDLSKVDLVIESTPENIDQKRAVADQLSQVCKASTIVATTSPALSLKQIAAMIDHPENVVGINVFSLINTANLFEVIRGESTALSVIASVMALAKRVGKFSVQSHFSEGFIAKRIFSRFNIEADQLVLEGATPTQVDKVLYDFGFPKGPFAIRDIEGLDNAYIKQKTEDQTITELLCASGRQGQKNGKGYYDYDAETQMAMPAVEVERMIRDLSTKKGISQRQISDQEILERCIYSIINEAAKVLEDGIASRASDIDVVWVKGFGWPAYLGGPMFWADNEGLTKITGAIGKYHCDVTSNHWKLSPLLLKLADEGQKLQEYVN